MCCAMRNTPDIQQGDSSETSGPTPPLFVKHCVCGALCLWNTVFVDDSNIPPRFYGTIKPPSLPLPLPLPLPALLPPPQSIFVCIPCYNDPDVVNTVRSLLNCTTSPSLLTIGICLQTPTLSLFTLLRSAIMALAPTARILYSHTGNSTGPINARRMAMTLYRGESHVLSIDCHTRVRPHFDAYLLAAVKEAGGPAVITTYPQGFTSGGGEGDVLEAYGGTVLKFKEYSERERGVVKIRSTYVHARKPHICVNKGGGRCSQRESEVSACIANRERTAYPGAERTACPGAERTCPRPLVLTHVSSPTCPRALAHVPSRSTLPLCSQELRRCGSRETSLAGT